jgi:hypothetical protein
LSKIIPDFTYKVNIEGDANSLTNIKKRFVAAGGNLKADSGSSFSVNISSNSLAMALYPFSNDLLIDGSIESNKIIITVARVGERKAALVFLGFVSVIAVGAFIQRQEIKALFFPFFCYGLIYIFSFLPTHPAHSKIRQILKHTDEP